MPLLSLGSPVAQTQAQAQGATSPPAQGSVIRVASNLVAVPVSVTDSSGQWVRSLKADEFRVEENGKPQEVFSLGEPGKTPLDMALLFDVSASVRERFEFEQQAAARFLKAVMKTGDRASLFVIGKEPKLVQQPSAEADRVAAAVLSLHPTREPTAFFDTVAAAARFLSKAQSPGTRRVLVVISDGEDTNSDRFRLADAVRELQRTDCIFYSINPSGEAIRLNKISLKAQEGMEKLASQSGAAFVPAKLEDLEGLFKRIAAELQAQYLLGYYPAGSSEDGEFRRISVRIPSRPDLRVRARQGYLAARRGNS